jgi:protein-L-isoaspartate(D-aspartate) O-methyltransferase
MTDFATMRRMMVDGQIRPNDVTDRRVIAAMLEIPREQFLPASQAEIAYLDRDIPLGEAKAESGRFLLKPMVLAKLIQALDLTEEDQVLDVGCASGYSSAVLARLSRIVVALEQDTGLAAQARAALAGASHVTVVEGRLADGYPAKAPYHAILVNGMVETQPEALLKQLRSGGRLVCVEGRGPAAKAMLYRRESDNVGGRPLFDASAHVLPGFAAPAAFVF